MNIQDWSPLGLPSLISMQSKELRTLQNYSSKASILQCSAFFMVQLSQPYMRTGKTTALTIGAFAPPRSSFNHKPLFTSFTGYKLSQSILIFLLFLFSCSVLSDYPYLEYLVNLHFSQREGKLYEVKVLISLVHCCQAHSLTYKRISVNNEWNKLWNI